MNGKAVLYARVSTRAQAEEGYSLRQQFDALRKHAAQEGYEVVVEVEDPGYSGSTLDRPGINQIRELAASVDVVLAQDRDRISRDPLDYQILRRELQSRGAELRALNDSTGPYGEMLDTIMDAVAKQERKNTLSRSRRNMLQRAREGRLPSTRPPHGYSYVPEIGNYELDPAAMATTRRIFEMVAAGESLYRVMKTLNDEGIPTNRGARWLKTTIRRMIHNDVFRPHSFGEIEPLITPELAATLDPERCYGISWYESGGERVAIPVPDSGLPRDLVDAARKSLSGNVRPSRADSRVWELSKFLFCECGRAHTTHTSASRGKKFYYYHCSLYPDVHGKLYNARKLEDEVFWRVWAVISNPEALRTIIESITEPTQESGTALRDAHAAIEDVAAQRGRYQDMAARGLIDLDELQQKLEALETRRRAAEIELDRLQAAQGQLESVLSWPDLVSEWYGELPHMRGGVGYPDDYAAASTRQLYEDIGLRVVVPQDGGEPEITLSNVSVATAMDSIKPTKEIVSAMVSNDATESKPKAGSAKDGTPCGTSPTMLTPRSCSPNM